MKFSPLLLGLPLALSAVGLQAQLTETYSYTPNLALPDGNATGLSDAHLISGSAITAIGSLTVGLQITGNFNGDLYVYLRHETETSPGNFLTDGFAVLLNRVGRTLLNGFGYADNGLTVTLSDSAVNGDIHNYQSVTPDPGSPTIWWPDPRNVDPSTVLDTSPRTSPLSGFNGLSPNGRWTLFGADVQMGGMSQIDSWQLNFTAVPEPRQFAAVVALGLAAFALWRKTQKA
jgi:subtilisin-like proprotein convertase family protein